MKSYVKTNVAYLACVILFFLSISCENLSPDIRINESGINSITVPEQFNWKTSEDYRFVISNSQDQVIEITSLDKNVIYHKGTYIEDSYGQYSIDLNIPAYISEVKVNGNTVSLNGPTVIDLDMKAISSSVNYMVDLSGGLANLGDVDELENIDKFTVEAWINSDDWMTDGPLFYRVLESGHRPKLFRLNLEGGNLYFMAGQYVDYGSRPCFKYQMSAYTNNCVHIALVYDGSASTTSQKLKFFINGEQQTLDGTNYLAPVPTLISGFDTDLFIGSLGGSVDEIRFWDYARTTTQISDNYMKGLMGNEDGLLAYYQCNEGSGSVLIDKTSNYNGSMTSAVWSENTCVDDNSSIDYDFDGIADIYDDFPDDPNRTYAVYWPAAEAGTLIFEDSYPSMGDCDYNDLVVGYRFKTITDAFNKVVEIECEIELKAHGSDSDIGLAFQLPNANLSLLTDLNVEGYNTVNAVSISGNGLETGQDKPVVVVFDQISNLMGDMMNTAIDGNRASPQTITITMTPTPSAYYTNDFKLHEWNPFIIQSNNRGYELHLVNRAPTKLASNSYFGTMDDSSVPSNNRYYVTCNNIPWAIDFPVEFKYVYEGKDLADAYPYFKKWVESGGVDFTDWYTNLASEYRNADYIYSP